MNVSIVIAGSSNTDMVIKTKKLPLPGETVLGGSFFMNAGGKGANQAVAAARLNGNVTFIAKRGDDIFGAQAVEGFRKENIHTGYVFTDAARASGIALITVDDNGENCIAVASGANAALSIEDIEQAQTVIESATVVLVQLEIPFSTVEKVISIAAAYNKTIILNPAPAQRLPDDMYKNISIITPNETEAAQLTGITISDEASASEAAKILSNKGVQTVIITLGSKGALLWHKHQHTIIPAPAVTAADTTAAGDVFNGALAVAIAEGKAMEEAIQFANYAAALSVTKLGAQASAPYRHEAEAFMQQQTQPL